MSAGLGLVPYAAYLGAMQQINRAILNPAFFATFLGTLVLLPLCCWLFRGQPIRFGLLLAATVLYAVGVFGVTVRKNVPLNEQLDRSLPNRTERIPRPLRTALDPLESGTDVFFRAVVGLLIIAALADAIRK